LEGVTVRIEAWEKDARESVTTKKVVESILSERRADMNIWIFDLDDVQFLSKGEVLSDERIIR
jgi:hypothetical protein